MLTLLTKFYPNIRRKAAQAKFIKLFDFSKDNLEIIPTLNQEIFKNEAEIKAEIAEKIELENQKEIINNTVIDLKYSKNENKFIKPYTDYSLNIFDDENDLYKPSLKNGSDCTHEDDIINNDKKFIILNTGMGSGKTFQTIEYLKNKKSFIWMTPIVALAQNTHYRLEEEKIECQYYQDFDTKEEKAANMCKFERLIICINSLHYTKTTKYKIVIIDEIETFLIKLFNNPTFKDDTKFESWNRLLDIIKCADKVIFLDAFISNITLNFIKNLKCGGYKIYERLNEKSDRTVFFMANYNNWLGEIIQEIKNNKKIFIFYPYLREHRDYPSMQELKLKIEQETQKLGVCYNSQADDKTLKELKNVNKSWKEHDFVITNTKITVGINYENTDYDSVYLSVAGFTSTRDIIQVSYRCRHIKSNIIKVCYIEHNNTNKCYENDDYLVGRCTLYKSLVKDILIEKNAPLKSSFLFFCNKAHYTVSTSKDTINKELVKYIDDLFKETNTGYTFETIPTVTDYESKDIEIKLFTQDATLVEKLTMQKYYFMDKFSFGHNKITPTSIIKKNMNNVLYNLKKKINKLKDIVLNIKKKKFNNKLIIFNKITRNTNKLDIQEKLKCGWDNRYDYFFQKLSLFNYNNTRIINIIFDDIKLFNKWDSIFPTNEQLNEVKLSDDLRAKIFKKFHFVNLVETSHANFIITHIYNSFFGKNIIRTDTNGKNVTRFITEEARDMFNFGLKYLTAFKKENVKIKPNFTPNNKLDVNMDDDEEPTNSNIIMF